MSDILKRTNSISPLSEEANAEYLQCIRAKRYKKGELVHSEGKVR